MNKQKDEMGDSKGYFKKNSERETCFMRLLTGRKDSGLIKTEPFSRHDRRQDKDEYNHCCRHSVHSREINLGVFV